MAGLTIVNNSITADFTGQLSADGLHPVTQNFVINIEAGQRDDNAYNMLHLQFDGNYELNINDVAADGYTVVPNDSGYTWSLEQNRPPAGIYIVALIYMAAEIFFKVKKL